ARRPDRMNASSNGGGRQRKGQTSATPRSPPSATCARPGTANQALSDPVRWLAQARLTASRGAYPTFLARRRNSEHELAAPARAEKNWDLHPSPAGKYGLWRA